MKVLQVAISFLAEHPLRAILTTTAGAAATCLVIWIASSYDALHKTFDEYSNLALGRYQLAVAPIGSKGELEVPRQVLEDLRKDPTVVSADAMWAVRMPLAGASAVIPLAGPRESGIPGSQSERGSVSVPTDTSGLQSEESNQGKPGPRSRRPFLPELLMVASSADSPPHDMQSGSWINSISGNQSGPNSIAIRADVAKDRGWKLGDPIEVKVGSTARTLQIAGIFNGPSLPGAGPMGIPLLTPSSADAFVTIDLAKEIFGQSERISLIGVAVDNGADIDKFRFGWAPRLNRYETPVQFQEAFEIEEALDQAAAAQNLRMQSFAATGIALLVSALVVMCSLSMGVNERIRQYAVLRAIAFSRIQVAFVIVMEGFLLGLGGLLFGLLASWLLLTIVGWLFAKVLYHGISIGTWSVTLASISMLGGALIASLIPAIRVMRFRPMDAMAPRPEIVDEPRFVRLSLLIGSILVAINPILTFLLPPGSEPATYVRMAVGFVTMAVGFTLLAPLVVCWVDQFGSPLLARVFATDQKLLSSQISSRVWRSVGASVSLAFGLGLFLGIHVWGWTMLEAFVPGPWAPDALAAVSPGLALNQLNNVREIEGIHTQRSTLVVVEQPRLLQDLTGSATRATITRQDNIILAGLDPGVAFGGDDPLLKLRWIEGDPSRAIEKMQSERSCVVPVHFLRETGLKLDDLIEVVPPESSATPVSYTIVGAVDLHGWHWQTKTTGLRPRTHRAAALIFADLKQVSRDFQLPEATHVWFDYTQRQSDPDAISDGLKSLLAQTHASSSGESSVQSRVIPVASIRNQLRNMASRWLWMLSQVPLLALVIAAIGVLNVLLASVRSRRWEFGVLRSIGIDRSQITRAILAEGVLIAIVACVLSVSFGVLAGWCGCGLAQYISFFGGLHPPLVIPLLPVVLGVGLALAIGFLCALAPALVIGRASPLSLLQQTKDAL
ncbi:Macrolide export ATP-binding/permease protein MacB [Pirellula sp. SH-Sr6A]|uniref:ABC transporter permease n=1 Tax=Pirellula sp. SH-Sr6A TaxID=1632865 RepID=UPI00078C2F27|nr:ABC transporter permease [Pirellula sp. SH-Sr6A]AMV31549.1 Macrolide export ATP-binding/permease protein MacB [Pirellula sp. SH-Sr6A]